MKALLRTLLPVFVLCQAHPVAAQVYETNNITVETFVGSGFYGHFDGDGIFTMFNYPSAVVVNSASNFFVLDSANYCIRQISPAGHVSTFAGGGLGTPPGYGTNVSFGNYGLGNMTIDHANTLWLTASFSSYLVKVMPDGLVLPIYVPGISSLRGICADSKNNLYLSDGNANCIYRYQTNGTLEVFAGSGNPGAIDGNWIFTAFRNPTCLAVDAADNIYVWDSGNRLIRRINQNRDVVTLAGSGNSSPESDGFGTNAVIADIQGMTVDGAGNLIFSSGYAWVSANSGSSIRKMSPTGNITTIAGNFLTSGYANAAGSNALFQAAQGLCLSGSDLYVADSGNHRIRKISQDATTSAITPTSLELETYAGVKIIGSIGRVYRIESSTDMTAWVSEAELQLTSSPNAFRDCFVHRVNRVGNGAGRRRIGCVAGGANC